MYFYINRDFYCLVKIHMCFIFSKHIYLNLIHQCWFINNDSLPFCVYSNIYTWLIVKSGPEKEMFKAWRWWTGSLLAFDMWKHIFDLVKAIWMKKRMTLTATKKHVPRFECPSMCTLKQLTDWCVVWKDEKRYTLISWMKIHTSRLYCRGRSE